MADENPKSQRQQPPSFGTGASCTSESPLGVSRASFEQPPRGGGSDDVGMFFALRAVGAGSCVSGRCARSSAHPPTMISDSMRASIEAAAAASGANRKPEAPAAARSSCRRSLVMAVAAAVFSMVWQRFGPVYAAASVLAMLPVLLKMEDEWEPVNATPSAKLGEQEQAGADAKAAAKAGEAGAAGPDSGPSAQSIGTVYFGTQRGQSKRFAEALVSSAAHAGLRLKLADMKCAPGLPARRLRSLPHSIRQPASRPRPLTHTLLLGPALILPQV